jgi:hypothetical protein
MLWILLGTACAIYTTAELMLAGRAQSPSAGSCFGALDLESGRPLEVVIDRRTRTDPRLPRRKRRNRDR